MPRGHAFSRIPDVGILRSQMEPAPRDWGLANRECDIELKRSALLKRYRVGRFTKTAVVSNFFPFRLSSSNELNGWNVAQRWNVWTGPRY
jgi:hypothetical protein